MDAETLSSVRWHASGIIRALRDADPLARVQSANALQELFSAAEENRKPSQHARRWLAFWLDDRGSVGEHVRALRTLLLTD